jgi:NADPH:quinone reductase-like Zn-dependent oxidoreductase
VGVSFPRVPGIAAAGTVDAAPAGSGLAPGQKVVAMMGGMGRTYNGGYAEYTSVPLDRVYDGLEQVPQAHDDMEHDRAAGKLVVRVRH